METNLVKLELPDWDNDECKQSLKVVLKWEINNLLQRLADTGEEAVVITANITDDTVSHLGSAKGQSFLITSDLNPVQKQFLSYCKGVPVGGYLGCGSKPGHSSKSMLHTKSKTRPRHRRPGGYLQGWRNKHVCLSDEAAGVSDTDREVRLPNSISDTEAKSSIPSRTSPTDHTEPPAAVNSEEESPNSVAMAITSLIDKQIRKRGPIEDGNKVKSSRRKHTPKKLVVMPEYDEDEPDGSDDGLVSGLSDSSVHVPKVKVEAEDQSEEQCTPQTAQSVNKTNGPHAGQFVSDTDEQDKKMDVSHTNFDRKMQFEELENQDSVEENDLTLGLSKGIPGSCPSVVLGEDNTMHMFGNPSLYGVTDTDAYKPYRTAGGVFKAAHPDESPVETEVLDKSKRGVRKYQCPYCELLVRDRHDLKRHLRTHTKEKPYVCEICYRRFSRKWDLLNHSKKHENGDTSMRDLQGRGPGGSDDSDFSYAESKLMLSGAGAVSDQNNTDLCDGEEDNMADC